MRVEADYAAVASLVGWLDSPPLALDVEVAGRLADAARLIDRQAIVIERLKDCLEASGVSAAMVDGIAAEQPSAQEATLHEFRKGEAAEGG